MFHSSSLVPGFSPYVRTDEDLETFLKRLESTFKFCLEMLDAENSTLAECYPRD